MIIDFRARPPSSVYCEIFDVAELERFTAKVGAPGVSKAFAARSMEGFFDEMKRAGIDRVVALGQNRPEVRVGDTVLPESVVPNEHVHALQTRHPEAIVGVAGIDVTGSIHDPLSEIYEYVAEKGLRGIFIEPQRSRLRPDDPSLFPIYERCRALDVPVTIMTGPFSGPDPELGRPEAIGAVAMRYPDLPIVAAHGAWPHVLEMIAIAFRHENVHVCPDVYHFMPGSDAFIEAANGFMTDQLLFASAYPARDLQRTVEDFGRLGLEEGPLAKALGGNARRLLGL